MKVKKLKKIIENLPDSYEVLYWNSEGVVDLFEELDVLNETKAAIFSDGSGCPVWEGEELDIDGDDKIIDALIFT